MPIPGPGTLLLQRLPGVQIMDAKSSDAIKDGDDGSPCFQCTHFAIRAVTQFALELAISSGPGIQWVVEIGTPTDRFTALYFPIRHLEFQQ